MHAGEQIRERKMHKVWVEEAIKYPDETKKVGYKYYVTKKLNGQTLKVVYLKEKYIKFTTTFFIK